MYGTDWAYANSRLEATVVRIGQRPFFVRLVGEGCQVVGYYLDDGKAIIVKLDDLNLEPVPLGFCNFGGYACYLTRVPMRRDWRQGLRHGNFTSMYGHSAEMIDWPSVGKAIEGKYPTLEEALATKGSKSVAWCREWGVQFVQNSKRLIYKHMGEVGRFVKGKPILHEKYNYLREALEEHV